MNKPNISPEAPGSSRGDEAAEWFLRLQEQSGDAALMARFEAWLSENPLNADEFGKLEAMWGSSAFQKAVGKTGAALQAEQKSWSRHGLVAAGIVLLLVGASQFPSAFRYWQADYITAAGEQARVSLPDGSQMLLNTASAVVLNFDGPVRGVRLLDGEAYFDVRPDTSRPFRVEGRFGEVEVTGTAFTVRADKNGDVVVLQRGGVDVRQLSEPRNKVHLIPGQTVNATATALSTPADTDMGAALAWIDGRIVFDNQPIADVLKELGRYYPGRIVVLGSRIGQVTVSGSHRVDEAAAAIVTLAEAGGASVTHLPGIVILR